MGNNLIAQPLKGTIRKDPDPYLDKLLKTEPQSSEKEPAESIMIVDLTRKDLENSSIAGSVREPEICKIYSFSHLHQMISSVSRVAINDIRPVDVIKKAFPMGSMPGAQKLEPCKKLKNMKTAKEDPLAWQQVIFHRKVILISTI